MDESLSTCPVCGSEEICACEDVIYCSQCNRVYLVEDKYRSLKEVLSTLTPREERVLRLRFGIGEKSDHTLEEVGQDFDVMDNLPLRYEGAVVDPDLVYPYYDEQSQEFPGSWDTDARLCMEANAPLPACVLAVGIKGQMA